MGLKINQKDILKCTQQPLGQVRARTHERIITNINSNKAERRLLVRECGFSSSNREPYKPLGEPMLSTEDLIIKALNLKPVQKPQKVEKIVIQQEQTLTKRKRSKQKETESGFGLLSLKMNQAKARLQSVKFGKPLTIKNTKQTFAIPQREEEVEQDKLFAMKNGFQTLKKKMHEQLKQQIQRMENQQQQQIKNKQSLLCIELNKNCTTQIDKLRQKAKKKLYLQQQQALETHPWFNDFLKVLRLNGLRQIITKTETEILEFIKIQICDLGSVQKSDFELILALVPEQEFQKEEIQRIVKFLRNQLHVSELDFIEVLEKTGLIT